MNANFQIFYQPKKEERTDLKSITLVLYEFDEISEYYKTKIILEKNDSKYKIKKYTPGLKIVLDNIKSVDFTRCQRKPIDYDKEYYLIQYGDNKIETNDRADVEDILQLFTFDSIPTEDITKYKVC